MKFNITLWARLAQDRCDGTRKVLETLVEAGSVGEALHTLVSGYSNEIGRTREGGFIYWVDTTGKSEYVKQASYATVYVEGE